MLFEVFHFLQTTDFEDESSEVDELTVPVFSTNIKDAVEEQLESAGNRVSDSDGPLAFNSCSYSVQKSVYDNVKNEPVPSSRKRPTIGRSNAVRQSSRAVSDDVFSVALTAAPPSEGEKQQFEKNNDYLPIPLTQIRSQKSVRVKFCNNPHETEALHMKGSLKSKSSNPYEKAMVKKAKTSALFKYRSIGTALSIVSEDLAPMYSRFSRQNISVIQAERAIMSKCFGEVIPNDTHVITETIDVNGVEVYKFTPRTLWGSCQPRPTIIFYHGGGFTSNSVKSYETSLIEMAKLLNVQIYSPEYRLAPENPYPACLLDCLNPTKHLLLNSEDNKIDLNRYAIVGDSAGGDLAIWVTNELSRMRSIGEIDFKKARLVCPIYPCMHSFIFNYYPSLRAKKANKFLKPTFFSSRALYLLGFNGHDKVYSEIVQKNYHLSNDIRKNDRVLEVVRNDAIDFIKVVTDRYGTKVPETDLKLGDELHQLDYAKILKKDSIINIGLTKKHMEQILEVQTKFDEFLPKGLFTSDKIDIVKEHGCKDWLMVVAEHDHARDGGIILGKRLERSGLNCHTVVVAKAFHGFWTNSKLLGGFEEKDDVDVDKVLSQISSALGTKLHEDVANGRVERGSRAVSRNMSSSVASMVLVNEICDS